MNNKDYYIENGIIENYNLEFPYGRGDEYIANSLIIKLEGWGTQSFIITTDLLSTEKFKKNIKKVLRVEKWKDIINTPIKIIYKKDPEYGSYIIGIGYFLAKNTELCDVINSDNVNNDDWFLPYPNLEED